VHSATSLGWIDPSRVPKLKPGTRRGLIPAGWRCFRPIFHARKRPPGDEEVPCHLPVHLDNLSGTLSRLGSAARKPRSTGAVLGAGASFGVRAAGPKGSAAAQAQIATGPAFTGPRVGGGLPVRGPGNSDLCFQGTGGLADASHSHLEALPGVPAFTPGRSSGFGAKGDRHQGV